ncbi:zinc metalloprotease mde10 [Ophiostoma piceae UAMH 11346]|uniref:Disintegrin and metalloproteinase domain-containing protein B n=1 Tax=Ophiostoma piceae (strain UAMH 11346) TaxID=1262450 RepID=S3CLM0_OPHP1|nr:zinc metalloprotease mde10 [Ophiostoma piceae UAMH 11346]
MRPPGPRPWGASSSLSSSSRSSPAAADSRARNPLRAIARLHSPVLHSPNHRVHARSLFQLSFTLEQDTGRSLDVRLRLHPNHNIIADDAVIHHVNDDGSVVHELINRDDHRVYMGDAFVKAGLDNTWVNAGWASVYVHEDGEHPVFEGAFHLAGDHHHIQTTRHYRDTRVEGDPLIGPDSGPKGTADDSTMVVWRDSDIMPDEALQGELRRGLESLGVLSSCSSDGLVFNRDDMHPVYSGLDVDMDRDEQDAWLFARQIDGTGSSGGNSAGVNLTTTIGNDAGCPTTRKVALLGIAADCNYAAAFNSRSNTSSNIIQQINSASRVYESQFNVTLGIQNLVIQNSSCPSDATVSSSATPWNAACSSGLGITERLNRFSKWRGESTNDTNAFWMLLSTCATDSAVGLAWLGQLCVAGSQSDGSGSNETIAATNVVIRTSTEWQVMAHETGHTFGAVHDCTSQTCSDGTVTKQQCCPLSAGECNANGRFIMNPSTGTGITQFSSCTIGNVCSALGRNSVKSACLANNKNVVTITGSECGNGIVEEGEECDCGGTAGCSATNNACCNPTTCKFTTNALCDPSNDECCTTSCQLASSGTVCRASTGSCDPAETCSGTAAACPEDVTSPDGTSCTSTDQGSGLTCASGQCTSRNLQCKTLMGSLTTGNDTYACSSQGCQLSCASPEFGFNTCLSMDQNFLDGTPCQGGGHCDNGHCEGVDTGKEIASALRNNLDIVIPVSVVVGVLLLGAIMGCILSCFRRRRRRRRIRELARNGIPPPPVQPSRMSAWFGFSGNTIARGGGVQPRNSKYYAPPQNINMAALPPQAHGAIQPPSNRSGSHVNGSTHGSTHGSNFGGSHRGSNRSHGGPRFASNVSPVHSANSSDSGFHHEPPPPYVRPPPGQDPWRPTGRFA